MIKVAAASDYAVFEPKSKGWNQTLFPLKHLLDHLCKYKKSTAGLCSVRVFSLPPHLSQVYACAQRALRNSVYPPK